MDTVFNADYRDIRDQGWNGPETLCTEILAVQSQFLDVSQ